jgi:hypothetical protein
VIWLVVLLLVVLILAVKIRHDWKYQRRMLRG